MYILLDWRKLLTAEAQQKRQIAKEIEYTIGLFHLHLLIFVSRCCRILSSYIMVRCT